MDQISHCEGSGNVRRKRYVTNQYQLWQYVASDALHTDVTRTAYNASASDSTAPDELTSPPILQATKVARSRARPPPSNSTSTLAALGRPPRPPQHRAPHPRPRFQRTCRANIPTPAMQPPVPTLAPPSLARPPADTKRCRSSRNCGSTRRSS